MINGREGTGKSTLIKMIQTELALHHINMMQTEENPISIQLNKTNHLKLTSDQ